MLLRELAGGDPPHVCKLIFIDDPSGFGHRVMDGERVAEHVLTKWPEFDAAVAEKIAQGYAETDRSLTRRVFATADRFWIVQIDGTTLRTQTGGIRVNWRKSAGQSRDKEFRDRDRAVAAYQRAIEVKQSEGYVEKYGRKVTVPTVPKIPGKKGSR